jgi:hypothetical protein
MKTNHKRHIITAGLSKEEIAGAVYDLMMRYGDKIHDLNMDCDGVYFTTIEYIK